MRGRDDTRRRFYVETIDLVRRLFTDPNVRVTVDYETIDDYADDIQVHTRHTGRVTLRIDGFPRPLSPQKNEHAVALGALGGKVKSERKARAVRQNGKKGGRPRKTPK